MQAYEHRQWAPWSIVILLVLIALTSAARHDGEGVVALLLFFAIIAAGFARLTTQVDRNGVLWSFTFGVPGGHLNFADLDHAELTRTNLLEGWGVHWTLWHGWLWNVSGFRAVELFYRSGRRVTLGTDDPQGLFDAIERFRRGVL
jgi:hypothetical protein